MIYKYSQINSPDKMNYKKSEILCKGKLVHLGQLKLLMNEVLFLAKYATNELVLYIGAAPGYHIGKLADMFPHLQFDLWDPDVFDVEKRDNIKLYNEYFTNKSTELYKDKKIILISDIRNRDIDTKGSDYDKMDKIVMEDMTYQMEWCRLIKPSIANLKFRLPFPDTIKEKKNISTYRYLTGTIYFQPFGKHSMESRLVTRDYLTTTEYNIQEFIDKLSWFNYHYRCQKYTNDKWQQIMYDYKFKKIWDIVFSLDIIELYLKSKSKEEVAEYFIELIKYHAKRYDKKYNKLLYAQL